MLGLKDQIRCFRLCIGGGSVGTMMTIDLNGVFSVEHKIWVWRYTIGSPNQITHMKRKRILDFETKTNKKTQGKEKSV